jgi:hypothetical protein
MASINLYREGLRKLLESLLNSSSWIIQKGQVVSYQENRKLTIITSHTTTTKFNTTREITINSQTAEAAMLTKTLFKAQWFKNTKLTFISRQKQYVPNA